MQSWGIFIFISLDVCIIYNIKDEWILFRPTNQWNRFANSTFISSAAAVNKCCRCQCNIRVEFMRAIFVRLAAANSNSSNPIWRQCFGYTNDKCSNKYYVICCRSEKQIILFTFHIPHTSTENHVVKKHMCKLRKTLSLSIRL